MKYFLVAVTLLTTLGVADANAQSDKLSGLYRLKVKQSNKLINIETSRPGGEIASIITKKDPEEITRFFVRANPDQTYTMIEQSSLRPLHVDGLGDQLASVRSTVEDDYTKFILIKQDDGSYKIQLKPTGKFLLIDPATQLLGTVVAANNDNSKFLIVPDGHSNQPMVIDPEMTPEVAEKIALLKLINDERTRIGIHSLAWNDKLTNAAQDWSKYMADNNYFNHTAPDGTTPDKRARQAGYVARAGWENIAEGQSTPQQTFDSWMNSPGHKAIMLNRELNEVGLGIAPNAEGIKYWTLLCGAGQPPSA